MANLEKMEDFIAELLITQTAVLLSDGVIDMVRDISKDADIIRDHKAEVYRKVIKRLTTEADSLEAEGKINVE